MVLRRLFDLHLDRFVRSNFSYNLAIDYSSSYAYNYNYVTDICNITTGHEWVATLSLIAAVLGILTSFVYFVLVVRDFNVLASKFLFLNNFLLASFINLIANGLFDLMTFGSYCWHAGRLLCKALPTLLDGSENAMVFFMVAFILELNHSYVHKFLSKNTKIRKRTVIILWLVTIIFSIPEVVLWDLLMFHSEAVCIVGFSITQRQLRMYLHKAMLVEYLVPLLLLIVTLTHSAVVLSRRSNPQPGGQAPEENHCRSDQYKPQEENNNQCPPMRVTSVAIGVTFFVMKTPHYVSCFLFAFFQLHNMFLYGFGFFLYTIPSIVAPAVVLFSSPPHKKRLKETYQSIASCIAGRNVKKGFMLSSGDEEEKVEEIDVESEAT